MKRRRSNARTTSLQKNPVAFEKLEDRRLMIVGALAPPADVAPGAGFDGVVELKMTSPDGVSNCTGNLLESGRHILTAAHCLTPVDSPTPNVTRVDVTFEMPSGNIQFGTNLAAMQIHPFWTGAVASVGDLAILELEAYAPFQAEQYGLYGETPAANELNQIFTLIGYGNTGTGATGQQLGTGGEKRLAQNEVGQISANGLQLVADFDDGSNGRNTLGDSLGLGDNEGAIGQGDSGGSGMLVGNLIMGVSSFITDMDANFALSNFGDTFTTTRVSQFIPYITGFRDAAGPLIVDMNLQEEGNNFFDDALEFSLNGTDLEVRVNDVLVYAKPFAGVTSIEVIGSSDDDTVTLDYSGGDPVPAGGFDFSGNAGTDTLAFVTEDSLVFDYFNQSLGSVTNSANSLEFETVEQIEGGNGDDEFRISGFTFNAPLFDGKGGSDSYVINNANLSANLQLDAALPEGFSGGDRRDFINREFRGIERFAAAVNQNSPFGDTVIGIDGVVGLDFVGWIINGSRADYEIEDIGVFRRTLLLENFEDYSAGSFGDSFNVLGTQDEGITLRGGAGDDLFTIVGAGTDLSTIQGEVRVEGGAGFNSLWALNKEGAPSQVTITRDSITGIAPAAIKYDNSNFYGNGITGIVVWGSDHGDDTFVVDSMFDFNSLRIDGFGGDDHLMTTSDVLATQIIWDGGEGSDRAEIQMVNSPRLVTAVDSGTNGFDQLKLLGLGVADLINVRDTSVSNNVGNTTDDIRYDGRTEQLSVLTRAGNDVVTIDGSNAERVYVQSGNGDDVLQVARTGQASEMELRTGKGADRVRVNSTNPNTVVSVKTQHDADRVFVGSTKNRDNGSLDRIGGSLTIDAGISAVNESDRLYINDRDTPDGQIYRINENRVESLSPRIFMGLEHSQFEVLLLDGTDQADEFEVSPSAFTRFVIDGNLPEKEEIDCSDEGDFLNLVVGSGSGRNLQFTNAAAGAGYWGFENGFQGVHFSSIERFNHVERLALGSDAFEGAVIRVLDAETRDELFVIQPYESTFTGGVRVATGDVTGDGIPDIIAAPGAGRAPEVRIYDGVDGQLIESFMAYDQHMWDGVLLATGDVGDSCATDIVTTTGPGAARAEVRVWQNGTNAWEMVDSFLPFGSSHYRGADVAVADFNGDGTADIAVGALHGRAHVAVFDGTVPGGQAELARFLAFDDDFYGGVHVTVGNVLGSDIPELIVSAGHNNWASQFSSQVHIYDGETLASTPGDFTAPDVAFQAFQNHHENRASTRIEAKDYDQDGLIDEIFAAHGPSGNSGQIHIFEPSNNTLVDSFFELDHAFERGIFMG